jgi:hypothetical protein
VTFDMSAAGITVALPVALTTPAGAGITNLRGAVVVDSAFDPIVVPSDPQGAAYIWDANNVWLYKHNFGLDATVQITTPAGAAIAGCWGVMPIFSKAFPAAALPVNPAHKVMIWDAGQAYVASGTPAALVPDDGGNPMLSRVGIGNPLVKRQASYLYEIQGTSAVSNTRGLVIGMNQRHR